MPAEFSPDAEWMLQIALDCACDLPTLAREAIAKFNAGEYYAQHDLLETLWRETESPVRQLYQAVLQIGVAYYQIEQRNWRGAVKMLNRGLRGLRNFPSPCQGIDVAGLRTNAEHVRAELLRVGEAGIGGVDLSALQPVGMIQG